MTFPKIELHVEDPVQARELADPGIVLDVCPISNVRTWLVPWLSAAGVRGALCGERRGSSLQRIGTEFERTAPGLTREPA